MFLPSGNPAPFARVEARWLRGGGSFASVANEYGRFSMRVDRSAESIGEKTLGVVARSGTLVSNQTIVISWELGSRMWLPVRLRNPATLSARAVSVHGRGVAGAVFHVERRPTVITPGERRSTMAQRATFVADGDGRVQARVSAGLLMVWVRAPAGVFGPRISKAVGAGEAWEIGDRTVPDEKCVLRLRVSDTDGRPVSSADVRVEYGESVQRWLSDGPVDTRFHFMTDLDGVATIPTGVADEPLYLAVGAPGFTTVRVLWNRSRPGLDRHTIQIPRRPAIRAVLVTHANGRVPSDLRVRWVVRSVDPGNRRGRARLAPLIGLGVGAEALPPPRDTIGPEAVHEMRHGRMNATTTGAGEVLVHVNGPGKYRIRARIDPHTEVSGEVQLDTLDAPSEVRLTLPAGRVIRFVVRLAGTGERQRVATDRELRSLKFRFVGARDAKKRRFVRLFADTRSEVEGSFWVPDECSYMEIRYGRLESGIVPPQPIRVELDGEPIQELEIPALQIHPAAVRVVVVRLTSDGRPIQKRGLTLSCVSTKNPRRGTTAETEADGMAYLWLMPDEYEIRLGEGSTTRKVISVRGSETVRCELEFRPAD